jgi:hypothetical protein
MRQMGKATLYFSGKPLKQQQKICVGHLGRNVLSKEGIEYPAGTFPGADSTRKLPNAVSDVTQSRLRELVCRQ